jgi:hypothetical protein
VEDNIFQHLTRDGAVNVGGKDVFHSQHPTKTVNLSEGKDGIRSEP